MATTWNGNHTPEETDMWNLVSDMRKQAILNNRVIPVYSKSERDGLNSIAPDGVVPEGTVVLRMDQSANGAVFDVYMNAGWMPGDSGVITSGVSIIASGAATLDSYSLRRRGTTVTARVDLTYTGATLTGGADYGNITDTPMFTIADPGWQPVWATYAVTWTRPGASIYFGRVDTGGLASITNLLIGGKLDNGTGVRMDGSWQIL